MKNLTRNTIAMILAVLMIMSVICVPAVALSAKEMADYSENHWAAKALDWSVKNQLIKGYDDNTLRPDNYLTRAEMATVINRAFGATILGDIERFTDVSADDWFYDQMAIAVKMGTFEGDENSRLNPNDPIRREEAFVVVARALVLSGADVSALQEFGDANEVSKWAQELLADLTKREFINGSPVENQEKNNIYPTNYITRAEFSQLLYNIFTDIIGKTPVKGASVDGHVLLNYNKGKLVVEDVSINGDLIIGDGIAANEVVIKNVNVSGRIVIRGGMKITFTNVSAKEGVVVSNNNATVEFQNYKEESIFRNIIAKTPVTFLKEIGGGSWVPGDTTTYYTVTFRDWQGSQTTIGQRKVVSGSTLPKEQFLWATRKGFEETYTDQGSQHIINNDKWVLSTDNSVVFDENYVVTQNIEVWPQWNRLTVGAYIEPIDELQNLTGGYYNSDTRAIDTLKDFIFKNKNMVLEVISNNSLDGKVIGKLDIILDANRNIKLIEKQICIVETLGSDEVKDMIEDAFAGTGMTPEQRDEMDSFVNGLLGTTDNNGDGKVDAEDKHVEITDDNIEIVNKYAGKIDQIEYQDIKDAIPEEYKGIMNESEMETAFNDAKAQYKDEIYEALLEYRNANPTAPVPDDFDEWYNDKYGTSLIVMSISTFRPVLLMSTSSASTSTVTSYVTIKVNPITSVIIPKYDAALNKLEDRFGDKYDDNDYFKRLIEIFDYDTLLETNGQTEEYNAENGLSGYKLRDNEYYYELLKEAVVMADEAGKVFKQKLNDEEVEELSEDFARIMTENMTTINNYLDKYIEDAINKIADADERLEKLNQYKDRRLTAQDIENLREVFKKVVTGFDTTVTDVYDRAYNYNNDKLNSAKFNQSNIPQRLAGIGAIDGFYKELSGNEGWVARGTYTSTDE